ncbi:hypothetical protein HNY73_021219 [Argiope bruennichi]|uniref:Retroviral polymerase SH3-like domain-containing protein n=1 Tax=Argiope bruennichi TaxID=94029 RepID=A0A8T0EE12_ARGBR|nr:hypothetical protein HNY73_021219 [Argiope bruennichi]
MKNNESANDYVARARGIATKCHSLGLDVTPRELVYYTVRGLKGKFSKVREILKTQRDKSMDEILEILREEENTCYSPTSTRVEGISAEVFYSRKNKSSGVRLCYICRCPNHIAKDCFYRNKNASRSAPCNENNQRRNAQHRANQSTKRRSVSDVFTTSHQEESLSDKYVMRNKFEVPGKRGIMLGFAKERKGYRIYDIQSRKIIEERSVKFNESLKGSTYLGKTKAETWDINSLLETSPAACEINQKTKNEISSLEIPDESAEDENSDSSILYHSRTSPQTDAAIGDENETLDVE